MSITTPTKIITKVKSGAKMEGIVGYSRIVAIDDLIFISNTAGRNPETGEMPDTFKEQVEHAMATLKRSLESVGAKFEDIVSYRAYAPDPQDLKDGAELLGSYFRGIDPCCTVTCSPLAAPYYKFEIEATAYRGASDATVEIVNI